MALDVDKAVKLAIVAGVLMGGGGVFYHYVIFLLAIEREKSAAAEQKARDDAAKEANRALRYRTCLDAATENYNANWAAACRAVAQDKSISYRDCLKDRAVMSNEFLGKAYCDRTYGNADASSECSLPGKRAEGIESAHKEQQAKCATEARLGLD